MWLLCGVFFLIVGLSLLSHEEGTSSFKYPRSFAEIGARVMSLALLEPNLAAMAAVSWLLAVICLFRAVRAPAKKSNESRA
jgi:uncharacterized membrane protein